MELCSRHAITASTPSGNVLHAHSGQQSNSRAALVNALVVAFNTVKVGDVGAATLQGMLPSDVISMAWALACVGLVGSQSFTSLSTITSLMVSGLFVSFAGLLLPGLANMPASPMSIFMAPGTSPDVIASACQLAPIILMSLVY
jgi:hypothetical protein